MSAFSKMRSVRLKLLSGPGVHVRDNNKLHVTSAQIVGNRCNVCLAIRTRLPVVRGGLIQDDYLSAARRGAVEATQHSPGVVAVDPGIGNVDIITLGAQHCLKLGRPRARATYALSRRIACTQSHDSHGGLRLRSAQARNYDGDNGWGETPLNGCP